MKITSQSPNELMLQEGSATGIVVGIVFVIGGALAAILRHSTIPLALWLGLAGIVVGALVICLSSSITVNANKSNGQLSYQKKRLIGTQSSSYAIADVLRIETRKQWQVQNTQPAGNNNVPTPQQVLVAQSVIVFKNGKELALDHQKTSSSTTIGSAVLMSGQGRETAIANQVASFLGVPFQEIMPPAMGIGLGGGGVIQF